MQCRDLFLQSSYIQTGGGRGLSTEEKASLQTSLVVLQANSKLHSVRFWGMVLGTQRDYYIAEGLQSDLTFGHTTRKIFCSVDAVDWVMLPDISEETRQHCAKIRGRFMGNASFEYTIELPQQPTDKEPPKKKEGEGNAKPEDEQGQEDANETEEEEDEEEEEGEGKKKQNTLVISEEKRLHATVLAISEETNVAPRGAYVLTADHRVIPNRAFEGLSPAAAMKLNNYCHLRPPRNQAKKTLLEKEGLCNSLDFMDTIDEDKPRVIWSQRYDPIRQMAVLRSLIWPGFTFYHAVCSPTWGHCYIGTGEPNHDNVMFMLP
eukprot:TRINITY_DN282_c0_g2_i1.p1 TRINITY_DN282_c0_g2~~TRINITY_DN282_c0_g2_i1.p1  ORF type:complete len:334 (+),score=94.03 TRINITY_DN282_c0_g2_i1:47-1003(+)